MTYSELWSVASEFGHRTDDDDVHSTFAAEMGDNVEFFKGKKILVTGVGSGKVAGSRKRLLFP